MSRDQRTRDRDFDREYNRGSKRYNDDRGYNDYYGGGGGSGGGRSDNRWGEFRTLCVTDFSPRIPDNSITTALYQQFERFGEFNVKVVLTDPDRKIAFVNFRFPEDAKEAKYAQGKTMILFERELRVDPVLNRNQRSRSPQGYSRDSYSNRSGSPHRRSGGRNGFQGRDHYESKGRHRGEGRGNKFPYYLHHIQPEDDDKATRTLFVGNLEHDLSETDLRTVFEKYGVLEDIDIKRPTGQGNAYAFIKFLNLDMAHRAKVNMSGQYIGTLQCKIGYGKATPTTCLWVGGLGSWVNLETLEAEFDRFGVISRIVWPHGQNSAYVLYDSIDAAQAACKEMRGYALGGPDKRLRIDFADPSQVDAKSNSPSANHYVDGGDSPRQSHADRGGHGDGWSGRKFSDQTASRPEWSDRVDGYRNPDNPRETELERQQKSDPTGNTADRYQTHAGQDQHPNRSPVHNSEGRNVSSPPHKRARTGNEFNEKDKCTNGNIENQTPATDPSVFKMGSIETVESVTDLAKCLPAVWSGALLLKKKVFSARMHLVSGDVRIVDTLMRDPTSTEMPLLKITQRLHLEQSKLDEVRRRVTACGPHGHSVLLAVGSGPNANEDPNTGYEHRPLRNLVSYLKQKEAAGVIALPPNPSKERETGVLHAFPPCQFGQEYLLAQAPKIGNDTSREDYLIILVVRGAP